MRSGAVPDKAFLDAVSDDLNIPLGLGELWTLLKNPPSRDIYDAAMRADKVLALSLDKCDEKKDDDVPADIRDIAERRFAARNDARADRRTDLIVTAENKFAAPANPKLTLDAFPKLPHNAARRHGTGKQRFGDAECLQNL